MIRRFLILPIRFYQLAISPYLGRWCRFDPSCSEYARQAIMDHGVLRGSWLAIQRLSRCHPFCSGGVDPVPEASNTAGTNSIPSGKPSSHTTHLCHG